jgi:hypothetical protein
MDAINAPRNFSWSYSQLTGFETCPRRFHESRKKDPDGKPVWPEEKSDMLIYGDVVHRALAESLRTGTQLQSKHKIHQHWIDKVLRTEGELLVEEDCKWAINREMKPVPWFAKDVWLRCIADAVKLDGEVALVVDWKAGKSANCDPVQLTLTSLMVMLQFPKVLCVRSDFIWLQEDAQTTQTIYRNECAQHWAAIMPRVTRLEQAFVKDNFPPTPNRFCRRYCPIRSCEYHGT